MLVLRLQSLQDMAASTDSPPGEFETAREASDGGVSMWVLLCGCCLWVLLVGAALWVCCVCVCGCCVMEGWDLEAAPPCVHLLPALDMYPFLGMSPALLSL